MLGYGRPAKKLFVIGVTGTKGKSSVAEMLYTILTASGHKTALAGTIRFAIAADSRANYYKMTLPGRGFVQKFLAEAVAAGCTHAVIELTSEAALQYRHLFLDLDALIFTNLHKEHVESHGSFEKYFAAKMKIGEELALSPKRPRAIIANADDARGKSFLALPVERSLPFASHELSGLQSAEHGSTWRYGEIDFSLPLVGAFNAMNALAAVKAAEFAGVPPRDAARTLSTLSHIPGRTEHIEMGQPFLAVVDYAHTPDSLKALYTSYPERRKICVLGNTGGGRDTWKRPEMAKIAEQYCAEIYLTNEDPYDEDPLAIIRDMERGLSQKKAMVIVDRHEAIRAALRSARAGDAVLITGKGTDPYIMGPKGTKHPWSDAVIVREELAKLAG